MHGDRGSLESSRIIRHYDEWTLAALTVTWCPSTALRAQGVEGGNVHSCFNHLLVGSPSKHAFFLSLRLEHMLPISVPECSIVGTVTRCTLCNPDMLHLVDTDDGERSEG